MKNRSFLTLGQSGIAHVIAPLLVLLMVGVVGSIMLVSSHAASLSTAKSSKFFIFSNHGSFKYAQINANPGFKAAQCGTSKITNNKPLVLNFDQTSPTHPPQVATCLNPVAANDGYVVTFYVDMPPVAGAPRADATVLSLHTSSCVFLHANDANGGVGAKRIVARNADGSCNTTGEHDTPTGAAPAKTKKLEGILSLYNDGRYEKIGIGVSTLKGQLEAPVPNDKAYCYVHGQKVVLAEQSGQSVEVPLPKSSPLKLKCSSSSFNVFFLKKSETIHSVDPFSRVAPSVVTHYCTYVHASGITASNEQTPDGKCPENTAVSRAAAKKFQPILTAAYVVDGKASPIIKIGTAYEQTFELKLPGGQPMSPPECAAQIQISHPQTGAPARAYSIRYNTQTKTCTFVQHVTAQTSAKYPVKKDSLHLVFEGNKYLLPASTNLLIDRVR